MHDENRPDPYDMALTWLPGAFSPARAGRIAPLPTDTGTPTSRLARRLPDRPAEELARDAQLHRYAATLPIDPEHDGRVLCHSIADTVLSRASTLSLLPATTPEQQLANAIRTLAAGMFTTRASIADTTRHGTQLTATLAGTYAYTAPPGTPLTHATFAARIDLLVTPDKKLSHNPPRGSHAAISHGTGDQTIAIPRTALAYLANNGLVHELLLATESPATQ